MDINEIKQLLKTDKYKFLRENEYVKDKIMLLTIGGSYGYGTNVEGSDVDIRGIVTEGPKELLGLSNFDQFDDRNTDTVLYGLTKIVSLLIDCNPNTIELLGTNPEHVFQISDEGKMLKDNVDLFLSRRAANSFGGYANQQLKRLENALARDKYSKNDKEKHILKTFMKQMAHFNERYSHFDDNDIDLYITTSEKEKYEKEIFMNINLNHYPLRDFKNIYSEMSQVVKTYGKLQHRNKKKDHNSLLKHAMHLVRLLIMGTEILSGEGINTYRDKDRELLLNIRNGELSFEEIFDLVNKYDEKFVYAKNNTTLPKKPNYNKIEELVMEINKRILKKYNIF